MEIVLKLIGIIIIAIGVECIFDARRLVSKFFSTSDTNTAARNLKIAGGVLALLGGAFIIFVK